MKRSIPDLRDDHHEITLDHCWVLLTTLAKAMDLIDGQPGLNEDLVLSELDPEVIRDELEKYFEAPEFSRLFNEPTGLGKGVLVGIYLSHLFKQLDWGKND